MTVLNTANAVYLGSIAVDRVYAAGHWVWPDSVPLVQPSALHSAITFARSTTGTYFDSAGVMQTAAINAPRYEYDPATLAYLGLLIEPQRTNLISNSEDVGGTGWAVIGASMTGGKLIASSAFTQHLTYAGAGTNTAGLSYVHSCDYKDAGNGWVIDLLQVDNDWAGRYVNLSSGETGTTYSLVPDSVMVADRGGGFFRVNLVDTAAGTGTVFAGCQMANGDGSGFFFGDNASGIYIRRPQIEVGTRATSYIPTSGMTVTRSEDVLTVATAGLDTTAGTFVMEHDCPAGDPLLGDGATAILVSQGPGKIAIAYDATGTGTVYNGGAETTAAAITLGATLRILATSGSSAIGHCKTLTWYPGKQTEAWMQGETT